MGYLLHSKQALDLDRGAQLNFADLFPFSADLNGVDQLTNRLFIHTSVAIFCGLLALTLFLRLSKQIVNHFRHISVAGSSRRQAFWSTNGNWWWPWLKRHFLYAPLFRVRHNREFRIFHKSKRNFTLGTLPGRSHTLLLALYCLCNILYCTRLTWNEPLDQVLADFRGRCGVLSAVNLVPTVIFALRNNPLIWLLEVPYDTFNLLHRWLGRFSIALALLHTLAWFLNTAHAGGWHAVHLGFVEDPHGPSFRAGMVGSVAFTIILIQTFSPLRHAFYETFLNVHKIMVAVAIGGIYMHWKVDMIQQLPWAQFCLLIWLGEYMVRAARIIYHNVSWKRGVTRVTVEALPADACRVTFDLAGQPVKQSPGAHSHIYLPELALHSSHPFSIAWTDVKAAHHELTSDKLPMHKLDTENAIVSNPGTEEIRGQVSFIVRAREGFTRKLFDRAQASENGVYRTWGLIEGAYGGHDSLASYGTVLLFAGGVGITHQVQYIRDLIQKYRAGLSGTRKIVLVWSVPNTEALEWVKPWMDEILRLPGRRDILTIKLFVTRPRNNREARSTSGSIELFPGRCDADLVLEKEVAERQGAMVVTVCGPGAFADDVRRAVRKRVQDGVIDFVEEAFTY